MSAEFRIDIEPGSGQGWRFKVRGPGIFEEAGIELERDKPDFQPSDLEEMRRGQPEQNLTERVSQKLSRWFFGTDLIHRLAPALQGAEDGGLRLVLSVNPKLQLELADVPFELMQLDGGDLPLLLNRRVDGLVHLLPKAGRPLAVPPPRSWPLRVLLFRANPKDLGGSVPPLAPLADGIRAITAELGLPADALKLDLVSSEEGVGRAATFDAFHDCLNYRYDVIVFLGHGELLAIPGTTPSSWLQFESPDGSSSVVSTKQMAEALQDNAPVVLLAGCLTAAVDAAGNGVPEELAAWMQGQQGVAQALVNSFESSVRLAVGMRYKLENSDAQWFLKGFFKSLLKGAPGNVEIAVRKGRADIYAQRTHPPGWAAPMVFRALDKEPVFEFMAQPPQEAPPTEARTQIDGLLNMRRQFWGVLSTQPESQRPPEMIQLVEGALRGLEEQSRALAVPLGPMLMPARTEAAPGQTATVLVTLWGALKARSLEGRLNVPPGASLVALRARPELKALGGRMLSDGEEGVFRLQPASGGTAEMSLPDQTPLFEAELRLDAAPPRLGTLSVEIGITEPRRFVWPGENALIVAV